MKRFSWISTILFILCLVSGCIRFDSAGNAFAEDNADGTPPSGIENFLAGVLNLLGDSLVTVGSAAGGLGAAGVAIVKHRQAKRAERTSEVQDTALVHVTTLVDKMREANTPDEQKALLIEAAATQLTLNIKPIVQAARVKKV